MKTGFKTSEFALAAVAPLIALAGAAATSAGYTLDIAQLTTLATAALSAALASHGYSGSRAKVKTAETNAAADAAWVKPAAPVVLQSDAQRLTPPPPVPPVDPPSDGLTAALAVINA